MKKGGLFGEILKVVSSSAANRKNCHYFLWMLLKKIFYMYGGLASAAEWK